MPRSSGVYTLPPSYLAVSGQTIEVENHNPPLEDIAQALTDSLPRDGSAPMTGNLPMGGNKITGLATATNPGDAVRFDQVTNLTGLTATVTELNYTDGVTSAIQTQLDGKQASDPTLTSLSGLSLVAGDILYATAADTLVRLPKGTAGQTLVMNSGATAPEWVAGGFQCRAWVNFHGVATNGTYSRTGTTVTVTMTAHGMTTGMIADLDFTSGTAADGSYTVTVVDANTFTVTTVASGATSGNVTRNTFIRASGNVSSITDNGVGTYAINFTNAVVDANYAIIGTARIVVGVATTILTINGLVDPTTTSFAVQTFNPNGPASVDPTIVSVAIFR